MLTYFQALSDVAEVIHNYRREHSGLTTGEGKVLADIQEALLGLHREEQAFMDRWLEDIHGNDIDAHSYGGTE